MLERDLSSLRTGTPFLDWMRAAFVFPHRRADATVLALIFVFLIVRLVLAATIGFTIDESYATANARDLSLSYFDHPPLHYWVVHASLPILGDGHALRLPFIALFAGSSWLLYLLTRRLFSARAGVWAVLALNLSAFFTVSAGGWVVPDGLLDFFVLAAAVTLANAFFGADGASSRWRTWILTGIWIGLAGLSKYHVVLFVLGLLLFIASMPGRRRILLHPAPWFGALIALAIFTPVLIWNAQHDWVSFVFQGGRGLPKAAFQIGNVLVLALAQAVWILPWIFVPLAIAGWRALRAGRAQERSWYCICLGVPTVVFFAVVSLWRGHVLPHWPMLGWLMLYPILGDYLDRASAEAWPRRWAIASSALFALSAILAVTEVMTGAGKLLFPAVFAHGDPTLEAFEWTPLYGELKDRGFLDRKDIFVIGLGWGQAGRIDQALHGKTQVVAIGDITERKNFDFRYDPNSLVGRNALVILSKTTDIDRFLRKYFQSTEELPPFSFGRSGMQEIQLRMIFAKNLLIPLPSVNIETAR